MKVIPFLPFKLHERKCTWLYVIQDTVTALQGKTPYLYRHDLVQLFQQELITQKLVQKMDKLPERLKPKAFNSSIRMPETKYSLFIFYYYFTIAEIASNAMWSKASMTETSTFVAPFQMLVNLNFKNK